MHTAKFPAYLFSKKDVPRWEEMSLISKFERDGATTHSPAGDTIWIVKEYCDRENIPCVVQLAKRNGEVIGARICKRELAEEAQLHGIEAIAVYDSHGPAPIRLESGFSQNEEKESEEELPHAPH